MTQENDFRDAEILCWVDPTNTLGMVLRPDPAGDGKLAVSVRGGEVEVRGIRCIYRTFPCGSLKPSEGTEAALAKILLTLPLQSCQITWEYREEEAGE